MRSSIERRDGVSFKSLIGEWSQMVVDQVRISVLIYQESQYRE